MIGPVFVLLLLLTIITINYFAKQAKKALKQRRTNKRRARTIANKKKAVLLAEHKRGKKVVRKERRKRLFVRLFPGFSARLGVTVANPPKRKTRQHSIHKPLPEGVVELEQARRFATKGKGYKAPDTVLDTVEDTFQQDNLPW